MTEQPNTPDAPETPDMPTPHKPDTPGASGAPVPPHGAAQKEEAGEVRPLASAPTTRAGRWLDNFWYHYKVQVLIAAFLLVVTVICVVQCARKVPEPDFILCYAGECDLRPTATNTAGADMEASVTPFAVTGAGKKDAAVTVNHYLIRPDAADTAVQTLTRTNIENLRSELDAANGYLFLLDESLYNAYTKTADGERYVVSVAPYLPESSTVRLTPDGRGVYLHSTALGTLPGFASLPEDTVLCLRTSFSISTMLSQKKADALYATYEALFRAMLINPS